MSGSRQRQPAGLDSLPSDLLQRVAQLGFLSQVSPFWDRGDLLQQAASLACVGNASFSELARILFAGPSPRLGAEKPRGVSKTSPIPALKAALGKSMNTSGGATSTKLFLLFDVKQLARKIHGSWEQLAKQRSDTKELYDRNREVWQLVWA
ncbi:expressed protein [Chlorella variabilis]|uniref:Expressed protein n=1 Tax=Chlorella variabilis TaxID=554065 RepID=E1ZKJ6_CHLVA|nr:expressed protein [Chlorella variabilis]EFN53706.1 expressed protein [Chlorella variabilis]|eukprot:XP_005845808.1 expressed protein [Chlorella variabilis]